LKKKRRPRLKIARRCGSLRLSTTHKEDNMIHLGNITKISGYTAPIVDVVVGGSPCQDLSVAGKRAGLDGERSGLFMEQLRIVKEMRERDRRNGADVDIRPRYMVWENVPGAFSSNKAEDFRIVLEETAKVIDKDAVIPMPNNGKWTTSGCILGNGWSIAWRVCDAQFYGVPQRRRRIALIADFGGHSAPEILFVRKSLSRDTESSKPKGKETPTDASRGIGTDDSQCFCFEPGAAKRLGGYVWEDLAPTLRTELGDNRPSVAYTMQDREGKAGGGKGALIAEELSATLRAGFAQTLFQPVYSVENHPADSRVDIDESGKVQTLTSRMGTGGGNVPMVMEAYQHHGYRECDVLGTLTAGQNGGVRGDTPLVCYWDGGQTAGTLTANNASGCQRMPDKENFNCVIQGTSDGDIAGTLDASYYKGCGLRQGRERTVVAVAAVDCRNCTENSDINGTLQSHMSGGSSLNLNNVVRVKYIVRRLTPLECERLQGYPDGWTDIGDWTDSKGKVHKTSDAARYKALGNSIALPPWKWVLKRLCACYERDATLASLFDGIGGFPLIWEQINGKGSCLWASEIEDFPIAVTKARIGEKEKI
jgi:DNA (cytosine-5)-methyltransferase 1